MAKYLLRRTFFGPDGARYRTRPGGVELPEGVKPPSTAVLLKGGEPADKNVGGEPVALSQIGSTHNPPGDPEVNQTPDYESWTVDELQAEAGRRGVKGRSSMDKDALVKALS